MEPVRKRLLIVVSSFDPAINPDMHRARMLCHELPKLGWDVEILTPNSDFQRRSSIDPDSAVLFEPRIAVHRVAPWQKWLFRLLGMESPGWRAWWPMFRAGSKLLRTDRFDLVYFSTTQFSLFCLGPPWRRLFHVPYVLDFQDPWYLRAPKHVTTERSLKRRLTSWLAKPLQRFAIGEARALVAVSPRYLDDLQDLYRGQPFPWLAPGGCEAIPFAGSLADVEATRGTLDAQPSARRANPPPSLGHGGKLEIVYVGAGSVTRLRGWEALCEAALIVRDRHPRLYERFRIRLFGTTGKPTDPGAGLLERTAQTAGLDGLVEEFPEQVSYFHSLELAARAAGLLILGVDDAAYTPSKLFSYLLFDQPVLAVCHARSPAAEFLRSHPQLGHLIDFDSERPPSQNRCADSLQNFMQDVLEGRTYHRADELQDHLAPAMARRHAELFNRCLSNGREPNLRELSTQGTV
jgi:hypothetical protein